MILPRLGVGIIYWSGLEPLLEARPELIDVLEVEPQAFWFDSDLGGGAVVRADHLLQRLLGFDVPKLVHGVGSPIGGRAAQHASMETFGAAVGYLDPPWVSEHLSFDRVLDHDRTYHTGFLLPPRQDERGVEVAAAGIRRLRSQVAVPVAFEIGVNYLKPRSDEMPDGEFFAAVAETADCGILLDLHNLWCNAKNGRQTVETVLDDLPLDRVWEVHLAGGHRRGDYWLDAHSDLVPDEVMAIAEDVIPGLGSLGAIIFEIIPEYLGPNRITTERLADQLEAIHRIWGTQPPAASSIDSTRCVDRNRIDLGVTLPSEAETVGAWEQELGSLVVKGSGTTNAFELSDDPGVAVIRHITRTIRAGQVVSTLPLTYRLLRHGLGPVGTEAILASFWRETPPEPFGIEEVRHLAEYLLEHVTDLAHMDELIAFELALREQLIDGKDKRIRFTTEPIALLSALGRGLAPPPDQPGEYAVCIEADRAKPEAHG